MMRRFSIGHLMALTGVVAVNLALVEASNRVMDMIIAVYLCGPIVLAVQVALHRSVFGPRSRRPFWLGFAASGAGAALALYLAFFSMPMHVMFNDSYASFWGVFGSIAPGLERLVSSRDWAINAAFALYYFVPQVLVAIAGGALAHRLARVWDRRGRDSSPLTG